MMFEPVTFPKKFVADTEFEIEIAFDPERVPRKVVALMVEAFTVFEPLKSP
jgi:hypothetical protein